MNKKELITIIKRYYSYDDLLKDKLRIENVDKYDLVIVSPTWKPYFVFNDDYIITDLKKGTTATYELMYGNKRILYIKTGKGAPNLYDNLLLLHSIDKPYVFLGSAGSLTEDINVGDIVVPKYSISGDGASLYFEEDFSNGKRFEKIQFSNSLFNHITEKSKDIGCFIKNGSAFSTDTLIGEYYQLDKIMNMGASCIEQETAAFGKCMNIMEKEGIPILVISDSLVKNQNYYEPLDNKTEYLNSRTKKLQKIINTLY